MENGKIKNQKRATANKKQKTKLKWIENRTLAKVNSQALKSSKVRSAEGKRFSCNLPVVFPMYPGPYWPSPAIRMTVERERKKEKVSLHSLSTLRAVWACHKSAEVGVGNEFCSSWRQTVKVDLLRARERERESESRVEQLSERTWNLLSQLKQVRKL